MFENGNLTKDADCLQPRDVVENTSRCCICAAGLSYIENMLYGNRCVFCAPKARGINLLNFLMLAYYDHKIYRALTRYQEQERETGRIHLLAALGVLGYTELHFISTVGEKRALLKEIGQLQKTEDGAMKNYNSHIILIAGIISYLVIMIVIFFK